jgi:hypothetical protein
MRTVDKGYLLNSHVGNTGSNPVGTSSTEALSTKIGLSIVTVTVCCFYIV